MTNFENVLITYVKKVDDVPFVGSMSLQVTVSQVPKFDDKRSMRVIYSSEHSSDLGTSSISYRSINADNYRNRVEVNIELPSDCLRSSDIPYSESRKAAQKVIPSILAEHEKLLMNWRG